MAQSSFYYPFVIYHVRSFGSDYSINGFDNALDEEGTSVLVPEISAAIIGSDCENYIQYILEELKKNKPEYYSKVKFVCCGKKINNECFKEPVVFRVSLDDEYEFHVVMSEIVYSLNWHPEDKKVLVKFEFSDKTLKNKFGEKVFFIDDVVFPVFKLSIKK